jgi:DNA-binding beta-propeller fold protein YncE
MKIRLLSVAGLLLCGSQLASVSGLAQALLVVNQGDATVSFVDPVAGKQIALVHEPVTGVHGHEIAASSDGRTAYVPVYGSTGVGKPGLDGREILVVDVPSHKVVGAIEMGHGVRPHQPVFDSKRGVLYVTTELDRTITVIDPRTRKIVGTVPTGQDQSHMFALSHDGHRGYTANVGPGSVSVLDLDARKTLAVIPVSGNVQRISVSMDDRQVFTADMTSPRLAVVDTASNKVGHWIDLPTHAYGTAPTPDGRWLLVTLPSTNELGVVDLRSLRLVRRIKVGSSPQEVLIRPDAKVAYVSCMGDGTVAVVDLQHWTAMAPIAAGPEADGLAWAP